MGEGRQSAADEWIDENFRFIVPSEEDDPTLEWILQRCHMAVTQHNCNCIVIDPWNEIDHCRDANESITEYTGNAIKKFRRMARKLNIHLVVAAHPAKMRKEDGKYQCPTLYDISDSAHWFNKADVGLAVYRPDVTQNVTEIVVLKARYVNVNGKPGTARFSYNFKDKTYVETI
jgi:twinkle protein